MVKAPTLIGFVLDIILPGREGEVGQRCTHCLWDVGIEHQRLHPCGGECTVVWFLSHGQGG